MQVVCNGQSQKVASDATVSALLCELCLSGPVAVEVNKLLVPSDQHASKQLNEGDVVEIVTLVGGG